MIDAALQIGFSNACVAAVLAMVVLLFSRYTDRPQLIHWLWILVLIKLVTPPVFLLPIDVPWNSATSLANPSSAATTTLFNPSPPTSSDNSQFNRESLGLNGVSNGFENLSILWQHIQPYVVYGWFIGTGLIVCVSIMRVRQFQRLLKNSMLPPAPQIQRVANRLSKKLGLHQVPEISLTSASISPFVWWIGGRVQIVLPQSLLVNLSRQQWQWVLAHELAHVRRRDHWVRWLEWFTGIVFWWNPTVWLAQRNLRSAEEICCDALVVTQLKPASYSYATSLISAIEVLASPVVRPPAMASEINSGGNLQRRIEMILAGTKPNVSGRQRVGLIMTAMILIPLGLIQAQDFDAVKKRLTKAVNHDEITLKQAAQMMEVLHHTADAQASAEHQKHQQADRERAEVELLHQRDRKQAVQQENELHQHAMEIREAVRAGALTVGEAEKRIMAVRKRIEGDQVRIKGELAKKSGMVDEKGMKFRAAEIKIHELIASGKMTKEQGLAKLGAIKKTLWADHLKQQDRADRNPGKTSSESERINLDAVRRELAAAVEASEMTREDAARAMGELQRHLEIRVRQQRQETQDQKNPNQKEVWEGIERRIEGAVESKKLTREQAVKAYAQAKRRIAAAEAQTKKNKAEVEKNNTEFEKNKAEVAKRKAEVEKNMAKFEKIKAEIERKKALAEKKKAEAQDREK